MGDENRNLPRFCLPTLTQDPLTASGRIIRRWKGLFEENPTASVARSLEENSLRTSEINRLTQIRDISAFQFWLAACWTPPPTRRVFSLNSHSFLAGFGVFWRLEGVFY